MTAGATLGIDLAPGRGQGLALRHPVLVAAGGAGYGNELLDAVGELAPAAIVTRSLGRRAHQGNAPPRMARVDGGLLSSVGLHDPGLEAVLRRQGSRWAAAKVPIIVSICADTAEDISVMAATLDMHPEVAGVELNLACGDRGRAGEPIGLDVEASETATVAARAATDLPLIVKLTASAPDPRLVARAVVAAGADAISAVAPLPALVLASDRRSLALGTGYGGLSGPALKPLALRVVYEIAQVVRVPIVGIGGVSALDDVLDYLAAGATAVGLATAALADPALPGRLAQELTHRCEARGIGAVSELRGTALPGRHDRGSLRSSIYRP